MTSKNKKGIWSSFMIVIALALIMAIMLCERRVEAARAPSPVAEHHFYADPAPTEGENGWWSISYSLPADHPDAKHARVVVRTEADE